MKQFKEYCNSWNKFEASLLLLGIILIFGSSLIYSGEWLAPIAAFAGFFYALNQAKGKVISHFIGLLEVVTYSWLSYKNQYYGEVILFTCFIFPLCIGSLFTWLKNENEVTHKVIQNTVKAKEWLFISIANVVLFIGFYFLLNHLDTDQLLISTCSLTAYLTAAYLIFRRSKYSFCFYLVNDLMGITLWGILVLEGNNVLLPILFEPLLLLVNDIYGWVEWNKDIENGG